MQVNICKERTTCTYVLIGGNQPIWSIHCLDFYSTLVQDIRDDTEDHLINLSIMISLRHAFDDSTMILSFSVRFQDSWNGI